eukprot:snap_masked-scaffold_12-processed-gene-12.25-mRNA-1 protein AED:0.29 eAED:0.30 QI:0/0/0/0.5/1/1/4/0/665
MSVAILSSFFTGILLTEKYIAAPYIVYILLSIFSISALKSKIFPTVKKTVFLLVLSVEIFSYAIIAIILFVYSAFEYENSWDIETKKEYHLLLDCEDAQELEELPEDASAEEFEAVFIDCNEAFILWASPLIFVCGSILFSGVLFFFYRAEKERSQTKAIAKLEPTAQIFIWFVLFSVFGLYIAASISSATTALADTILSLSLVSLILVCAIYSTVFGLDYIRSQFEQTSLGIKAIEIGSSDWGKSLAVILLSPAFLIFLVVDFLKQFMRKHACCKKYYGDMTEEEKQPHFTKKVQKAVNASLTWNFGSILPKILVVGMAYFLLSVGITRMTVVFLSYLREQLESFSLLLITFILLFVGLLMFMIPVIPGVPVYIVLGLLLVPVAEAEFGSLVLGILYALLVSLCLKLFALVLQQKIIGEGFGSTNVAVRRAVGVNSITIRAMKKILMTKGLSFGKVAILIGGPDWPTNVLTGLLRLDVFQMMLGTLPVVFLILPTIVSGAMLIKTAEEPDNSAFSALSTISVLLTTIVQAGSMLVATNVIASGAVKYEKELSEEEPDQEVLELDNQRRAVEARYKEITSWNNLTKFWKKSLIIAVIVMTICCYSFQLFGSSLFVDYEITDSVGDALSGNALFLVTNEGWVVLVLFSVSSFWYFVFHNSHKNKEQ